MSGRHHNHDKGSSRSTRDDSRKERELEAREKRRSRSRSPRRRHSPSSSRSNQYLPERSSRSDRDHDDKNSHKRLHRRQSKPSSDEEVPAPPPPPRISKISIGFSKPKTPITMNLSSAGKSTPVVAKPTIASVFNTDDDDEDEPEEMPAEAKMRMRNIGRETPTSAGPNSFGKTKQGFCDAKKVFEKNMKHALETVDRSAMPKFPQTIYKIKGP